MPQFGGTGVLIRKERQTPELQSTEKRHIKTQQENSHLQARKTGLIRKQP